MFVSNINYTIYVISVKKGRLMEKLFADLINNKFIISPFQIIGTICLLVAMILSIVLLVKNKKAEAKDDADELSLWDKLGLICSVVIIALCLFVSIFVIQITRVESGSMEPTLMTGEYCIINKFAYITRKPTRGDMVCFYSNEYNLYLLKRIVGIPGDNIEFHDGSVYINGQEYNESSYLNSDVHTYCDKNFVVPNDSYFMMGDNREYSTDSRYFNSPYISVEDIQGKMIYHWKWPKFR